MLLQTLLQLQNRRETSTWPMEHPDHVLRPKPFRYDHYATYRSGAPPFYRESVYSPLQGGERKKKSLRLPGAVDKVSRWQHDVALARRGGSSFRSSGSVQRGRRICFVKGKQDRTTNAAGQPACHFSCILASHARAPSSTPRTGCSFMTRSKILEPCSSSLSYVRSACFQSRNARSIVAFFMWDRSGYEVRRQQGSRTPAAASGVAARCWMTGTRSPRSAYYSPVYNQPFESSKCWGRPHVWCTLLPS